MRFIVINLYIITNILDYGFMLGYGLLIFTFVLQFVRKFDQPSIWMKLGLITDFKRKELLQYGKLFPIIVFLDI